MSITSVSQVTAASKGTAGGSMCADVREDPPADAEARHVRASLRDTRLLVVHGQKHVAAALTSAIRRRGLLAASAVSAIQALAICGRSTPIDVVLMDLKLAGRDGQLIALLRATGVAVVLALVALCNVASFARASAKGADDCVVWPFPILEVLSRIAFSLRRARRRDKAENELFGEVAVDLDRRAITVRGCPVRITRKEFGVVAELIRAGGVTVSRQRLLVTVWQTDWHGGAQTVAVHVCTLRAKLGRPSAIQTVGHAGYRLLRPEPPATAGATANY